MGITMDIEQVREYTLSINGVTEDQPFGDDIITFRIEGKIFLCLWLGGGKHDIKGNTEPRFALKLTPERNEELREQFSAVTPAWHWNRRTKQEQSQARLSYALQGVGRPLGQLETLERCVLRTAR